MRIDLKRKALKLWRNWRGVFLALLIVMAFRSAIADWNDVPTGSMKPTIIEGDRIFVNKVAYDLKIPFTRWRIAQWGNPKHGDVVVLFSPADEKRLVKRVIGLPGDEITMRENQLLINGEPLKYEPLARDVVNQLAGDERASHLFFAEVLAEKKHPVMIAPSRPSLRTFGPVVVPEGQYLVMGDNRDDSVDSRYFGFVERKRIVGQATAIALSLDRSNWYKPRWHRFFRSLP